MSAVRILAEHHASRVRDELSTGSVDDAVEHMNRLSIICQRASGLSAINTPQRDAAVIRSLTAECRFLLWKRSATEGQATSTP